MLERVPAASTSAASGGRPSGAGTLAVEDPATEEPLIDVANAQPEDALAALDAAAEQTGRVGRLGAP